MNVSGVVGFLKVGWDSGWGPHSEGVLKWLAAESFAGRKYGAEVAEVTVAKARGAKHVQDLGNNTQFLGPIPCGHFFGPVEAAVSRSMSYTSC
jgi:hypothetical protein